MTTFKLRCPTTPAKLLTIPEGALKFSGMAEESSLDLHADDVAMVILKPKMNAMELIRAAGALRHLAMELTLHLAKICGPCSDCSKDGCPFEEGPIRIPDSIREEAGISQEAKLCASVDEESHTVTVSQADHRYDLEDVPETELVLLQAVHTCLGELEDHLMTEDIVYGEE